MTSSSKHEITIEEVIQQLQTGNSLPAELLEIFAEEAEDHLRTIYEGLGRLKLQSDDMAALADVRRASHTLKGAAAAVNLQSATKLAHRMEDLLDRLAERHEGLTDQHLNLLLVTADQLQSLTVGDFEINSVAGHIVELFQRYADEMGQSPLPVNEPASPTHGGATVAAEAVSDAITPASAATSQSTQYLRVPLNRLDDLVSLLGEMVVNRSEFQQRLDEFESRIEDMQSAMERLRSVAQQVEKLGTPDPIQRQPESLSTRIRHRVNIPGAGSTQAAGHLEDFDPLEFAKYNEFDLLSQTLAEADRDAEIMAGEFRSVKSAFDTLLRRQQQLNRDAQKGLMKIRMVPLSGILSRLERTVRTVADKLAKPVELQVIGERIELDKSVLDTITDPILHLVRNAIGHGVETAEERIRAGKPATARLRITAVNQGTQVTLRISDDGAGINLDKVRRKALERELISEEQQLSRDELHALIFLPGFSTATQLTDVSGRGVGMDVVGEAIRRLKGTIRVESETGVGTTFTIQLPTTLGVARAVLVESSGQTFAIPMPSIRQIQRLDPASVTLTGEEATTELGNRQLRLIDLASHLHLGSQPTATFDRPAAMLILGDAEEEVAVTVDLIHGCQDVVIKTLGNHLRKVRGFMGATIGGDGSVIPILDTTNLVDRQAFDLLTVNGVQFSASPLAKRNLAMVIDDSISVRRVTESLLEFAGWDVVTAKDGVDALEKLTGLETPPDVFLCDMEMPRMDGLELMRQIREQAEFEFTPIVMVTSRASEKHRHKAFEAGATDYVVKPYNDVELLELITRLVQSARETVTV